MKDAKIQWSKDFDNKFNKNIKRIQQFVDSEALRYMVDYMPKDTGTLINTAVINTAAGSGEVCGGNTPYARRQYFENTGLARKNNGKRGRLWFERMKSDHAKNILEGAQRKLEGR